MRPPSEDLASAYGALVRHVVATVTARRSSSSDVEDLVADGMVALVESSRRFDPGRAVAFSTFAFHRVRGAVKDGLRKLEPASGRTDAHPTRVPGRDRVEPHEPDLLADDRALRPDEVAARLEAYRRLAGALEQLPARERALIEAHYGEDLSLDAAGRRLGLSKSWTSRLHARAIDKLGRLLEDPGHASSDTEPLRRRGAT